MTDLTYRRIVSVLRGLVLYAFLVAWPVVEIYDTGLEMISLLLLGAALFSAIVGFNLMSLDSHSSFEWTFEHHFWPVTLSDGEKTGFFPEVMARRVGTEWQYRLPNQEERTDQSKADAI